MEQIDIFMDDYRECPDGYVFVETIDECLQLLRLFSIHHLSLDHDLASRQRNGSMLIDIMIDQGLSADRITVHSANASCGKSMYNRLKNAQNAQYMPNTILKHRPLPLHYTDFDDYYSESKQS